MTLFSNNKYQHNIINQNYNYELGVPDSKHLVDQKPITYITRFIFIVIYNNIQKLINVH